VALLAGRLHVGGAEKQLYYAARALLETGADARVYYLNQDDFYFRRLSDLGVKLTGFGQMAAPPLRVLKLTQLLQTFRPHVLQAAHTYTNIYAAFPARLLNAIGLGAIRSNLQLTRQDNGRWTPLLLKSPHALVANSQTALAEFVAGGAITPERMRLLPNALDLEQFDAESADLSGDALPPRDGLTIMLVARLVPVKRIDLFIRALVIAQRSRSNLRGVIAGDGVERDRLEGLAESLGAKVIFLGARADVPALLRCADLFALTSDNEGFPNVIIEAMAARLPIVTTPAGDAKYLVEDGVNGLVVPFDDVAALASAMLQLADSAEQRRQFGMAGRAKVEGAYSYANLAGNLLALYRAVAQQTGNQRVLEAVGKV
jgi:glycosyltransferase involved in cell wall biosynthesis